MPAVTRHWLELAALSCALVAGCNIAAKGPQTVELRVREHRLAQRDTAYRLDPAARAELQPGLDAGAVERLLSHVAPSYRSELVRLFSRRGGVTAVLLDDPQLRAIAEDVYAPQYAGHTEAQLRQLAEAQPVWPGVRRALEQIEAARWTDVSPAALDTHPDFGIGIAYFEPGVDGTPPLADTVALRAAPAADAQPVARFIFSMPAGNGWSYAVLAPDTGASSNLREFGYEEAGLPIDSILPDSSWARLLYAVDRHGVLQRGWAPLWDGRLAYTLWSQWLPERAWYFLRDDDVQFFVQPGGARVDFPLARAEATDRSRFDYHLEPEAASARDGWLRVRVVSPSNACGLEPAGVQDTTVWVRYLSSAGRPLVWYYTRGC